MTAEYANPLAGANVTPERIDQGVDYAGTGTLGAIARGVVTQVAGPGSSGWPGSFIRYKITDSNSPLFGQEVFYAEGVTPLAKVGQTLNPGDAVAKLIPGWKTGIEIGFASGAGTSSYASAHGGYTEGDYTAAGAAFSNLIGLLGGPPGKIEGAAQPRSTAPAGALALLTPKGRLALSPDNTTPPGLSIVGGVGSAVGGAASSVAGAAVDAGSGVVDAATSAANLASDVGGFLEHPEKVLLTIALVVLGAVMVYEGVGRMLGFDSPVKSTAQKAAVAAATKAAA